MPTTTRTYWSDHRADAQLFNDSVIYLAHTIYPSQILIYANEYINSIQLSYIVPENGGIEIQAEDTVVLVSKYISSSSWILMNELFGLKAVEDGTIIQSNLRPVEVEKVESMAQTVDQRFGLNKKSGSCARLYQWKCIGIRVG